MKRERKKRIVFTRKGKKKPRHIKLLNGHDPQFQTAYQQHGNPNRNKQQASRENSGEEGKNKASVRKIRK